jgi:hypothetical protein
MEDRYRSPVTPLLFTTSPTAYRSRFLGYDCT